MSQFKKMSQKYLVKQAMIAFRNIVRNYDASITNDNFFTYRWSVWDFNRKRALTVDDIFKREAMSAVVDLVKSDMAWEQGCTNFTQYSSERCIEDFEELPKNFTIDERGIEFLFNAYEIACGAFGDIRGRLWWKSLISYIRSDFIPPQSKTKKGQ